MEKTIQLSALLKKAADDATSRLDVAIGCRNSGLNPVTCAPELYNYPDPSIPVPTAIQLSTVLMIAWGGILTSPLLTSALQAVPAYTPAEVTAAVANQYTLNFLDNYTKPTVNQLTAIALYQGNLVKLSSGEAVTYLIISCLPGDYSPSPGSMIAALASVGVVVGQLAQNMAANYLSNYHCWVSQPISNQPFSRLMVLEATGATTVGWIPGLFTALQTFATGQAQPNITVASAMLSTGSVGADPSQVLTALFTGAKTLMNVPAVSLYACKLVNYNSSWNSTLVTTFNTLKNA